MMKFSFLLPLALIVLSSSAFGMGGKRMEARTDSSGRFVVAGNVPKNHAALIAQDLSYLQSQSFRSTDPELLRVMEMREANGVTFSQWLADRVRFIVGEDLNLEKAIFTAQKSYAFENPGVLPDISGAMSFRSFSTTKGTPVTVMANIGTALYLAGKMDGSLLGIEVPGVGKVSVTSPRTGIIQIGKGLFLPLFKKWGVNSENVETEAYRQSRISTFLHEARHSDGNGKSLGFTHVKCPNGHDYAGTPACDGSLNGAYAVGALAGRALLASCKNCSAAEREALKLEILDSFNRVLKESEVAPSAPDGAMASLCKRLRELNKKLSSPIELPEDCKRENGGSRKKEVIRATYWDDRPEGRR